MMSMSSRHIMMMKFTYTLTCAKLHTCTKLHTVLAGQHFGVFWPPPGYPIYGGWRSTKQYIIRRETDGGLLRYLTSAKIVFFRVFCENCQKCQIMQIWQKWQNHMVMCNFAILRRSRCIPANFAHTKFRNHKSSSTSWWIYDNDIIINEFGKAMSERMFAKPKRCFRKLTNVFETQKLCREFERCWVQLISACRICESDFAGWEIKQRKKQKPNNKTK